VGDRLRDLSRQLAQCKAGVPFLQARKYPIKHSLPSCGCRGRGLAGVGRGAVPAGPALLTPLPPRPEAVPGGRRRRRCAARWSQALTLLARGSCWCTSGGPAWRYLPGMLAARSWGRSWGRRRPLRRRGWGGLRISRLLPALQPLLGRPRAGPGGKEGSGLGFRRPPPTPPPQPRTLAAGHSGLHGREGETEAGPMCTSMMPRPVILAVWEAESWRISF
jgi:hypothetical protein